MIKRRMSVPFLAAAAMWASTAARGEGNILFNPALTYISEKIERGNAESESSALYLNVNFGYLLGTEIGVGAKYFARLAEFSARADEDGAASAGSNDFNSLGLGLFYDAKTGIYAGAYYLHEPEREEGSDDGKVVYNGGSGYMLELAYKFKAGSVNLGPMIAYLHAGYEERKTPTDIDKLDGTWADTLILPFFGFWFYF